MGLRVNTNVQSLAAQRNLAIVTDRLSTNFRRLASGLRVDTAADDPAGLGISERIRSQISSLSQAARNAQDGVSLVQSAEGSIGEINGNLTRMRELAIQAASGTYSDEDRAILDTEFQALIEERSTGSRTPRPSTGSPCSTALHPRFRSRLERTSGSGSTSRWRTQPPIPSGSATRLSVC